MGEALKDIVVRVSARKEGFESLDSAASSVGAFSQKVEVANTASLSFSDRISKSAKGFETLGSMGMGIVHVLDRIEISQMAVENATGSVMNAQLRYNETLAKYGADSQQAFIAGNELARSQNNLEKANQRAAISMAAIGLSAIGTIPAIVTFGKNMVTTLKGVELATLITTARIKAMAPELLILSAVAGGAYYLWTTQANAAREAQEELTRATTTGFSNANEEADKLLKTIEEIKNIRESSEQRAAEAGAKREGTISAIQESSLSPEDKRERIARAELDYAQEIIDIRLSGDRESLKNSKDQNKIYEDMAVWTAKRTKLELDGQNKLKDGIRGLRGATAGGGGEGATIEGVGGTKAVIEQSVAISPFLAETQKALEEKKKEMDVNVKTWSAGAIPIEKEPGLVQKALGTAPLALGVIEGLLFSQHKTPLMVRLGQMLANIQTTVPSSAGIPILPATEVYQNMMRQELSKLKLTINLDRQGTMDFFKEGLVDTLNTG